MECLDESAVAALVERRLPAEALAPLDAHAGNCPSCRQLIAAAARALLASQSGAPTATTLPRAAVRKDIAGLAAGAQIRRYRAHALGPARHARAYFGAHPMGVRRARQLAAVEACLRAHEERT
jgi:predicted anti-sigma-YlaC factor YlaD